MLPTVCLRWLLAARYGCKWPGLDLSDHGRHRPTEAYYSYSIPEGIVHSFPVIIGADRQYSIVQGLQIDDFSREKMDVTAKELLSQRQDAFSFLDQQE